MTSECYVAILFTGFSIFIGIQALYNVDLQMTKWTGNRIPFYIDKGYDDNQIKLIRLAMLRVMSDLDMCVQFDEVSPDSPDYKIRITPFSSDASIRPQIARYCRSFAGKVIVNERNKKEQDMVLSYGPGGCFDGTLHSLMKYFAIALGKRNEHQGKERNKYVQVFLSNVVTEMLPAYRLYTDGEASAAQSCPYDYCSITHNQPEDFSKPGTQAFTVTGPPYFIPKLDQLSGCDCMEIKWMYGCDYTKCNRFDCAQVTTTTVSPNVTSAVTVSPSNQGGSTVCFSTPSVTSDTTMTFTTTLTSTTPLTTPSSANAPACLTVADPNIPPAPPNDFPGSDFFGTPDDPPRAIRSSRVSQLRTINADRDFIKWAETTVRYYLDPTYNAAQQTKIKEAIGRVMGDLKGYIRFVEVSPEDQSYKLKITPSEYPGINNNGGCRTFPGAYYPFIASNQKEQRLVLTSGANGCLDGSIGKIMKYFVIVLGRRNEHQRPDRDNYIQVNPNNIQPVWRQAYEKYSSGVNVTQLQYPYDYCSITHNEMTDYATPGNTAFTIKNNQLSRIPRLEHLSEYDCKIICLVYGCATASCGTFVCSDTSINGISPTPGFISRETTLPVTIKNDGAATTICYTLPSSLSDSTFTATSLVPSTVSSTTSAVTATTTCTPGVTVTSPMGETDASSTTPSSVSVSDTPASTATTSGNPSSTNTAETSTDSVTSLSTTIESTSGATVSSTSGSSIPGSTVDSGSSVTTPIVTSSGITGTSGTGIPGSSVSIATSDSSSSTAIETSTGNSPPSDSSTGASTLSGVTGGSSATTSTISINMLSSAVTDVSTNAVSAVTSAPVSGTSVPTTSNGVPSSDASAVTSTVGAVSGGTASTDSSATTRSAASATSDTTGLLTTGPSTLRSTTKLTVGQLQEMLQHMADEIAKQLSAKPTAGTGATPAPSGNRGTTQSIGQIEDIIQQIANNLMTKMSVTFPPSTTPMSTITTSGAATSISGVTSGATAAGAVSSGTSNPVSTDVTTASSAATTESSKTTQTPVPLSDIQQQLENLSNQLNNQLSTTGRPGVSQPSRKPTTKGSSKSPMGELEDALSQLLGQLGQLTKKPNPSGVTKAPKPTSPDPQFEQMEQMLQDLADQLNGKLSSPKKDATKPVTTVVPSTTIKVTTTDAEPAITLDDYPVDPNAPPPPEEW